MTMAKFIVLYTKPDDVEGFERYYTDEHMRFVEQWPNIQSHTVTRLTGTPRGGEPAYHLLFEATFASDADLQDSLGSEAARAAGKDLMEMTQRFGNRAEVMFGPSLG
jgi:uncharacterized protein (TIGR02118 family)